MSGDVRTALAALLTLIAMIAGCWTIATYLDRPHTAESEPTYIR